MKFSIIINNYNYGRFVGQAIESALAVDWRNKEIIVVDDGSTDDSRAVIDAFGDRVTPLYMPNGGQATAANAGFERSTGDLVIFLDADDVLLPTVAHQIIAAWRPGIAKIQYSMIYVDAALRPLGRQWPVYTATHTPEWAAKSMRKTGNYLSSPTSGNAWHRDFLKEIFPLPTRANGLRWFDMYLHMLAPFFGEIVSLTSPQCLYRQHCHNGTGFATIQQYLDRYPELMNQVETTQRLGDALLRKKGRAYSISYKNEYYTKVALVSKRFFPDRYPDGLSTLLLKYWKTLARGEFSMKQKVLLFIWSLAVIAAPRRIAGLIVFRRDGHARTRAKLPRHLPVTQLQANNT